jgi:hypothetical protein
LLAKTLLFRCRFSEADPANAARIAEARALAREAAGQFDDHDLPLRVDALALSNALGDPPAPGAFPAILHVDDLVSRYGPAEATRLVLGIAQGLRSSETDRALATLAEFNSIARTLGESRRVNVLRVYLGLIFTPDIVSKALFWDQPEVPPPSDEMVALFQRQAAAEGWSRLETARALLLGGSKARASEVVGLLEYACSEMPAFAALHRDAVAFHIASAVAGLANRVFSLTVGRNGAGGQTVERAAMHRSRSRCSRRRCAGSRNSKCRTPRSNVCRFTPIWWHTPSRAQPR